MIDEIVKAYRLDQKMTLRDFAAALSIDGQTISYEAIRKWENGRFKPNYYFLVALSMKTTDWRRDFAFDCLSAIEPDNFVPVSDIGRSAIRGD